MYQTYLNPNLNRFQSKYSTILNGLILNRNRIIKNDFPKQKKRIKTVLNIDNNILSSIQIPFVGLINGCCCQCWKPIKYTFPPILFLVFFCFLFLDNINRLEGQIKQPMSHGPWGMSSYALG